MDLFENEDKIILPNAWVSYYPNFYNQEKSNLLFIKLKTETDWQKHKISLFGKVFDQPRLTALYSDVDNTYSYSNIKLKALKMTPILNEIRNNIKEKTGFYFNSVLLNLYRDKNDSNSWHADNEKELGKNPLIASISLGEERLFKFKHNTNKEESYKIKLNNGSLLIMGGEMQHYWKHQIPKTKVEVGERINLTFRML